MSHAAFGLSRRLKGGTPYLRGQLSVEMVDESEIVALEILHATPHTGEAFTEAQVVRGVCFRRFTFSPIPISAVLQIDDVN